MSTANEDFQGVSNCYVFKSQLQEYAQKAGLPTPVYDTIKDGPSHEPCFRSIVILNDVRYDSLPGFFNRKAAEQSGAEVALMELAKSGEVNQSITQPAHETGLCKNLLQEYAQKMNCAMPTYQCKKDDTPAGRAPLFSCTVNIGGILYIGGTTKTKKEAEIKAARTALLAIQTNASQASQNQFGHLTVIPSRKRSTDFVADEASKAPKPKKARFKRKFPKKKQSRDKKPRIPTDNAGDGANITHGIESLASANDESGIHETKSDAMFPSEAVKNSKNGVSTNHHEKETLPGDGSFALNNLEVSVNGKSTEFQSKEVNLWNVVTEVPFAPNRDIPAKSFGMFVSNRAIPAKSIGMFVPNGDILAKSIGMVAPIVDIPAKSFGMVAPIGDIPTKSIGMAVTNGDIPEKSIEINKQHYTEDMASGK